MAEAPLRVLVLANLPPYVVGGAEIQVARLIESWIANGVVVEVAGHRLPGGKARVGEQTVITHQLRTWGGLGRLGRGLGYLVSLLSLALRRRRDFDIVYCRGLTDGALAVSTIRSFRICSWKIVAVPINARGSGDAHFLRSVPGARLWVRIVDRNVDAYNLINADLDADLDELGLKNGRRFRIPNGVPVLPRIHRATSFGVRRLVWTGRLEAQKGLDLLLEALGSRLPATRPFSLGIWGEGTQRHSLEAQAQALGLAGRVTFHGACEPGRLREVLSNADIFVLPSRYEGMSNSALEAMEAGLPVLCTRCGGVDLAVAQGAGWTCAPGDVDSLGQALDAVLTASPQECASRGARARELVEQRFSMRGIAAANLEMFKQVLRGEPQPR